MIPTVLGPIEASSIQGKYCSSHEHLLTKPSNQADLAKALQEPITLANLAQIRSQPQGQHARDHLFSLDEAVQELRELAVAGGGDGGVVLECTSIEQGRFAVGLVEVGKRSGIHVVMAASWRPIDTSEGATRPSAETIGLDLQHQLLVGEGIDSSSKSATTSAVACNASRVQAGFIAVRVEDYTYPPGTATQTGENPMYPTHPLCQCVLMGAIVAMRKTGAPVVVEFPAFETNYQMLAAVFSSQPDSSDLVKKVILTGMRGGASVPIDDQIELLQQGFVLCFDCFGSVEWFCGREFFPSDEESAVRIAELAKLGFAHKIVISQGVSRRTHLSRFGGFGYGHAIRTVPPRLRRLGVSADDIKSITHTNALNLLDWYSPPPLPEIPKDFLRCFWCKTRFEPIDGEYFHKFHFVYCGIKCLRAHRDTGFKELV